MAVQYASAPPQCLPAAYPPAYPYPTLPGQAPAAPAPVMQQSQQTVVISQPAATAVTVNNNLQDKPNHIFHLLITCICPWWIFVWCIICCVKGC